MDNNSIDIKIGNIPRENETNKKQTKYHVAIAILIIIGSACIISGMLLTVWNLKTEKENNLIKGYEETDIKKDDIPKEIYQTALQLASKNFELSRIYKTGTLLYIVDNNKSATVDDERYKTYQDLKNDIENTYIKSYSEELLNSNPLYIEKNNKIIINLENASIANIYTGKTNEKVEIKNYKDDSFEILYECDAYTNKEKTTTEKRIYTLKAIKENNNWKLEKMY